MNKKIFTLAFVSAVFFLGCSADSGFSSGVDAPKWDNALDNDPSTNTGGGGESGGCLFYEYEIDGYLCIPIMPGILNSQDCVDDLYGELVNSCFNIY